MREGRSVHADLPQRQEHPAAWLGPQMAAAPHLWTWRLTDAEIAEIESAADAALARGTSLARLDADAFALPTLAPKLAALRREMIDGRGFRLVQGLPLADWPRAKTAAAFLGIGSHVGRARSQNEKGRLLGHVRDLGLKSDDPNVRIYQTSERQTFHTDSCDVVALACLRDARKGGDSLLVSAMTIWNEMLARRPDLAAEILRPVAIDRRGEAPAGMKPYFMIAPLTWHAGRLTVHYQRRYVDSAQRFPDAPRLSAAQIEALDLFDALADDPALHFSMRLAPGDLQFVHNHALLHDRTAFEDWPDPRRRRHLLRLCLSVPGDRPLPACFAERFGSVAVGDRGGILVPGTTPNAPLEV